AAMARPSATMVAWDHVIGPDELEQEILPRLASFPEINAYVAGRTYRGRKVWAADVMLPIDSSLWSQAKASATKPVLLISTRQHANEVSSTSSALRFLELLATDPDYRKYLKRMNVVYHPMENPDGAANHYELLRQQPTYILHGGYWSSVGRDVSAYVWDPDPLLPEARVRRKLYYTWLPDVYLNAHGYPTHEWVHSFAGYKVPWFLAFWIPRGYHINLHHLDDPNYPLHKGVGRELRERIIEEVQGVPEIRAANERLIHRFEKYARRYEPDPFRLEVYKGMNILFDHSYSFDVGGPASREIYVSALGRRPNPQGDSFIEKHPQITVLDLGCDMPDETASPAWMEKIAARGQFGYLMAMVKLLYESEWSVERFEEDFADGVRLSIFRPRPVKASREIQQAPR
ncbi:MAG: M14 family metallopeptidase, partial [Acidobacteria bacterium]|nr:M14 family metallopeptidase [Acidobacteriota bacterium]